MTRFIPREKMGRKARRELDSRNRATWAFCPATRTVGNRKRYNRKRKETHGIDEETVSFLCPEQKGGSSGFRIVFPAPAVYNLT